MSWMYCYSSIKNQEDKNQGRANTVINQPSLILQANQMIAGYMHKYLHILCNHPNIHVIICFHICLWLLPWDDNLWACFLLKTHTSHTPPTRRYLYTYIEFNTIFHTQALMCIKTLWYPKELTGPSYQPRPGAPDKGAARRIINTGAPERGRESACEDGMNQRWKTEEQKK